MDERKSVPDDKGQDWNRETHTMKSKRNRVSFELNDFELIPDNNDNVNVPSKETKRLNTDPHHADDFGHQCSGSGKGIIQNDIPERMQIAEVSTGTPPTDEDSIVKEAKWIKEQFKSGQVPGLVNIVVEDDMEDHIKNFLVLSHVRRLDLPYIAMYCKECISCLLKDPKTGEDVSHDKSRDKPALKRHKVLWAVHDLDRKWLLIQKRKNTLLCNYKTRFEEISCKIDDETRLRFNRQVYESIISALTLAESERELDDVDSKFNLHFAHDEDGVAKIYRIWKEAGLWKIASKFSYSSKQLVDEMEDPKETPENVASNFTRESFNSVDHMLTLMASIDLTRVASNFACEFFSSAEAVLMLAKCMASIELSHEPHVKKYIRSKYFDNAVLSTRPMSWDFSIDAFHKFTDKPLKTFEDTHWLLIQKAEEEERLKVTIYLPEENFLELVSECLKLYPSDSVSELAQMWNVQRKRILEDAIIKYILPALEKEARLLLTNRAKNRLLLDFGERLWDKVSVAPYRPEKKESSSNDEAAPKVMDCCWGSRESATTFAVLDSYGEIDDVVMASPMELGCIDVGECLWDKVFVAPNQAQKKESSSGDEEAPKVMACCWGSGESSTTFVMLDSFGEIDDSLNVLPMDGGYLEVTDTQRLVDFMMKNQPQVVVVGVMDFCCIRLMMAIYKVASLNS